MQQEPVQRAMQDIEDGKGFKYGKGAQPHPQC